MIRAALALMVTLTISTLPAGAQPAAKLPKIGVLQVGPAAATQDLLEAFKQGMRERGYVEGQHVVFERRFGEGRPERLPDLAAELVRVKVDVIVTSTVRRSSNRRGRSRSSWPTAPIRSGPGSSRA